MTARLAIECGLPDEDSWPSPDFPAPSIKPRVILSDIEAIFRENMARRDRHVKRHGEPKDAHELFHGGTQRPLD